MATFITQVYFIFQKRRKYKAYLYSNSPTKFALTAWLVVNTKSVFQKPPHTELLRYLN